MVVWDLLGRRLSQRLGGVIVILIPAVSLTSGADSHLLPDPLPLQRDLPGSGPGLSPPGRRSLLAQHQAGSSQLGYSVLILGTESSLSDCHLRLLYQAGRENISELISDKYL